MVEEEEVGRVTHLGPLDVEGEELHLAAVEAIQVGLEHRLAHLGDRHQKNNLSRILAKRPFQIHSLNQRNIFLLDFGIFHPPAGAERRYRTPRPSSH